MVSSFTNFNGLLVMADKIYKNMQRSLRRFVKSNEICEFTCFKQAESINGQQKVHWCSFIWSPEIAFKMEKLAWNLVYCEYAVTPHSSDIMVKPMIHFCNLTNVHSTTTFIPMPWSSGGEGWCC